jgi:hypothetical protein
MRPTGPSCTLGETDHRAAHVGANARDMCEPPQFGSLTFQTEIICELIGRGGTHSDAPPVLPSALAHASAFRSALPAERNSPFEDRVKQLIREQARAGILKRALVAIDDDPAIRHPVFRKMRERGLGEASAQHLHN